MARPGPSSIVVGRLGFPFPPVFAVLSALSESAAVVLIALGLFTRPAAAVVAFNMAVAFYNEAGKGDPFELPALYLLLALVLVVAGPGGLAVDGRRPAPTHQKVNASRFSSSFFGSRPGTLPSAAKSANRTVFRRGT